MEKIKALMKALQDIGVGVEIETEAEWYCIDNKTHYGIEVYTDIPCSEYEVSFCFTPEGKYITSCLDAPIKKKG